MILPCPTQDKRSRHPHKDPVIINTAFYRHYAEKRCQGKHFFLTMLFSSLIRIGTTNNYRPYPCPHNAQIFSITLKIQLCGGKLEIGPSPVFFLETNSAYKGNQIPVPIYRKSPCSNGPSLYYCILETVLSF